MIRLPLAAASKLFRLFGPLAVLAVGLFAGIAFAQGVVAGVDTLPAEAPAAAPATPVWLSILLVLLPTVVAALIALKPAQKLADFLHARATDAGRSAVAKLAMLAGESLAKSVEHFLEATQGDYGDLLDPAKRAAALKHLEDQAKMGALPAVTDAAAALGSGWLAGASSAAVDAAAAKGGAVAVPPVAPSNPT